MSLQIEGFAIISDDGMLADADGNLPSTLVIDADQQFLSDGLDRADLLVRGRNSHENQPRSAHRRRLIVTRQIKSFAPVPEQPRALLWNPAGLCLENAAKMLGVVNGTAAILGGTESFGMFLCRYDVFNLSRVAGLRLPLGRAVFPHVPDVTPEAMLASSGLIKSAQRSLDESFGVTLSTWRRQGASTN
jgi:hypothetical protein